MSLWVDAYVQNYWSKRPQNFAKMDKFLILAETFQNQFLDSKCGAILGIGIGDFYLTGSILIIIILMLMMMMRTLTIMMVKFRVHRCATSKALINLFILCPLCYTLPTLLYSLYSAHFAILAHFALLCLLCPLCSTLFTLLNSLYSAHFALLALLLLFFCSVYCYSVYLVPLRVCTHGSTGSVLCLACCIYLHAFLCEIQCVICSERCVQCSVCSYWCCSLMSQLTSILPRVMPQPPTTHHPCHFTL